MRQRPRVDMPLVAVVLVRHVPPAPLRHDPGRQLRGPVTRGRVAASARPRQQPASGAAAQRPARPSPAACPGPRPPPPRWPRSRPARPGPPAGARRARTARDPPGPRSRPGRSAARAASSTCSARSPSRPPGRRPRISSAASGVANPPLTSRSHGLPRNSPLAAADVASSAPQAVGEPVQRGARPAVPGAPAGDEHRPPRPGQRRGQLLHRVRRRRAARDRGRPGHARRDRLRHPGVQPGRVALGGLHVQRQGQHHGPPLPFRRGR